ncbi:ATP-binding protein [Streptomyces sp. NPDC048603]|uniref:ATP-binding protein n=1 Tax=Streptomyces sp. NPDC048603 TaxID=3365577 RepID=UPI00371634AE
MTNACIHAGGPRELVLRCTAERLRIEVTDGNPEPPRKRRGTGPAGAGGPEGRGGPGGHGLIVLQRLSRSWGTAPSDDPRGGKTVWAEVPCPAGPRGSWRAWGAQGPPTARDRSEARSGAS